LQRHPGITTALALSRDGRLAAGGTSDRTVRVWELASGRSLHVFEGHTEAVACVALSDDGRLCATGGLDGTVLVSGGEDRTLRQWSTAKGEAVRVLSGPSMAVTSVVVSRDRQWCASTSQ